MMNTSEVLNRAADLIEERGWTTGARGMTPDGPLCMEGGVRAAQAAELEYSELIAHLVPGSSGLRYPYLRRDEPIWGVLMDYLETDDRWGLWRGGPYDWNDAQTNAAEVVEVLRAAAVIEASRERQAAEVAA